MKGNGVRGVHPRGKNNNICGCVCRRRRSLSSFFHCQIRFHFEWQPNSSPLRSINIRCRGVEMVRFILLLAVLNAPFHLLARLISIFKWVNELEMYPCHNVKFIECMSIQLKRILQENVKIQGERLLSILFC